MYNRLHLPMSDAERAAFPRSIIGTGPTARAFGADGQPVALKSDRTGERTIAAPPTRDERSDLDRESTRMKRLEQENADLHTINAHLAMAAADAQRKLDAAKTAPKPASKPKPKPSQGKTGPSGGRPSQAEVNRALASSSAWLADWRASRGVVVGPDGRLIRRGSL